MLVTPIELSPQQIADLDEISADFPSELEFGHEAEAVDWAQATMKQPTPSLKELACKVIEASKIAGAVAIRGLQLDAIPATPKRYQPVVAADVSKYDIPQLYISSILGEPYGSSHVRGGRILADIIPREGFEGKQDSAFGSQKMFDFHTDGTIHDDIMPDYFSMNCLRNTLHTPTLISTVSQEDLTSEVFELLQHPIYTLHYVHPQDDFHKRTASIIETKPDGQVNYNYYGDSKVTVDQKIVNPQPYIEALRNFHDALNENSEPVLLAPGDIAIINNHRVLHARPAFNSSRVDQSMGRWLRRVHIATQPSNMQTIRRTTDRILHSQYL